MKKDNWTLTKIWNDSLVVERKDIEARDHIWATDIGKNYWERYQKMRGVAFTNPYEERVLRKFAAGNYFEDLIGYVLQKVGILKAKQDRIEIPETKEHLKITGYSDFRAGGIADWNEARKNIEEAEFPKAIQEIAYRLVNYFAKEFPKGLKEVVYEVKSVNSQVFWAKKDYLNEAYPHHELQLYTYLRGLKDIGEGRILYISKDDLTIAEMPVIYPNPRLEEKWLKDVSEMSEFYRKHIEPPKPPSVIFDPRKKLRFQWKKEKHIIVGCWTDNWEIAWSPYFQLLGGKDKEVWEKKARMEASKRNVELKDAYKKKRSA